MFCKCVAESGYVIFSLILALVSTSVANSWRHNKIYSIHGVIVRQIKVEEYHSD